MGRQEYDDGDKDWNFLADKAGALTDAGGVLKYSCYVHDRIKDFLQKEEIENPLLEFSAERGEEAAPVTYKETERFYNGTERENSRENELYEIEDSEKSIEDLVNMQLHWKKISETDRKIVDFCVQSIEQSGYFLIPVPEIAKRLNVPDMKQAGKVLSSAEGAGAQGMEFLPVRIEDAF